MSLSLSHCKEIVRRKRYERIIHSFSDLIIGSGMIFTAPLFFLLSVTPFNKNGGDEGDKVIYLKEAAMIQKWDTIKSNFSIGCQERVESRAARRIIIDGKLRGNYSYMDEMLANYWEKKYPKATWQPAGAETKTQSKWISRLTWRYFGRKFVTRLFWGTIDFQKILWKSMVPQNCSVSHILQNIFLCVQQNKDIHTGLELLEGE